LKIARVLLQLSAPDLPLRVMPREGAKRTQQWPLAFGRSFA
jgi:hypothetical protein